MLKNRMTGWGVALLLLLLTSCGSQKSAVNPSSSSTTPTSTVKKGSIEAMMGRRLSVDNLTAKVRVKVTLDSRSIETTGTLRMRRDDVIQISLVDPLVGIAEIGRMEFSRDRVLIIDRFNKQYIDVPYADVSFLQRAGVDFNTLQSLFWNEVFQPGKMTPKLEDFGRVNEGSGTYLSYIDGILHYRFLTFPQKALLQQTAITSPSDPTACFAFDYSNFDSFDDEQFPRDMTMYFQMGARQASLGFTLSSLRSNTDWQAHTTAPTRYTKADPEMIFKSLVK